MPAAQQEIATACTGMAEVILEQMKLLLRKQLEKAFSAIPEKIRPDLDDEVAKAEESWRALSAAIATGVVTFLSDHLLIAGIQTTGSVNSTVTGTTGQPLVDPPNGTAGAPITDAIVAHHHTVSGTGTQTGILFEQTGDGTGHVSWKA